MGVGASSIHVDDLVRFVDDQSLREELESCRNFLTDAEMEMEDTESLNLPCLPSTFLYSTVNWIMYSKN